MVFLWVLGVLLGLLLLLCLLRIGAVIDYDGTLTVRVAAGPLRFQVFPAKEAKKEKKEEEKENDAK